MRWIVCGLPLLLILSACADTPPIEPPTPAPHFDALAFFAGHTLGTGKLTKILSGVETTVVHGNGHVEGRALTLVQLVKEGAKPPKRRTWHIREESPGHYSGTLTDASGSITGETEGNRLHLTFIMKGGLPTEQWLTLAADGRSAHNIMIVTKLGLRLAVLDENIRKLD